MENGVMLFQFRNETDLSMVENNGPWSFNGCLIAMKRWNHNVAPHEVTFNVMPIWVQTKVLPFEWCSMAVLTKLGGRLCSVIDVKVGYSRRAGNQASRIRTVLLLDRPLLSGIWAIRKDKEPSRINFKYERLPQFVMDVVLSARIPNLVRTLGQ